MLSRVVFFDFDGVLVDSVSIKEQAFGTLYEEYGLDVKARVMAHHRKHGGMSRFEKFNHYHRNFLEQELRADAMECLNQRFSNLVLELVIQANEMQHASFILQALHHQLPMHLISATPEDELMKIVCARGMEHYFLSIHGAPQKKSSHIHNIIEYYDYKKEHTVLIGDAINDYNASIEAGINFIGYAPLSMPNVFSGDVLIIDNLKHLLKHTVSL